MRSLLLRPRGVARRAGLTPHSLRRVSERSSTRSEGQEAAWRSRAAEPQVVVVEKPETVGNIERTAPGDERLRDRNHVAVRVRNGKRGRAASDAFRRPFPLRAAPIAQGLLRVDALEQALGMSGIESG